MKYKRLESLLIIIRQYNLYTVEHQLYTLIGTEGSVDNQFVWIIKQ